MTRDFDEDRYLLPALLGEVADQVPERCHLVWADDPPPGGHAFRAVCGYNASLSLEWGRSSDDWRDTQGDPVETEWSQNYHDPKVRFQDLDILLHGAAIYRQAIALVDGGRCWIPFPRPVSEGEGYEVTEWSISVVRLANDLVHRTTDTLDYVRRAELQIVNRLPLADE